MRYSIEATSTATVSERWYVEVPDGTDTSEWQDLEWLDAIDVYDASLVGEDIVAAEREIDSINGVVLS